MSTLTLEKPSHGNHDQRKTWTRDEAAKLQDLFPDQRLELIEGDLINKTGQKPPHAYVIMVLNRILSQLFPAGSESNPVSRYPIPKAFDRSLSWTSWFFTRPAPISFVGIPVRRTSRC
jgi:hypothetical protein